MHVDKSYFRDQTAEGAPVPITKAVTVAAPDTDAIIASLAPQWLTAGEVRGLLKNAAGAAKSLKSRVAAEGYAPVATTLRSLADLAGQTAGRAPEPHPLSLEQTGAVVGAVANFWKIAHLTAAGIKTTLDFRPTQKILQTAQMRKDTPPPLTMEGADAGGGGIPGWGWAVIGGVIVLAIGGTIWYFKSRKSEMADSDELPELYPDDAAA